MSRAKDIAIIIPAVALLIFIGVSTRPITRSSEGRVARVAQEMLETGDWIVPHLNGEVRKEKPPLSSWAVAGLVKISGAERVDAIHAFIPPGLAALALILLVYGWTASVVPPTAEGSTGSRVFPALAALFLATAPGFLLQARSAELDMLVALFTGLTVWGFYQYRVTGCVWALMIAYIALGLGILTKAHVPVVVAIPPLIIWHLWERARQALPLQRATGYYWHPIGVAILLLLTVPYANAFIQQSGITWADFNREGGTGRFSTEVTGHQEVWFWYLYQIPGWFVPWILLLPLSL